MNGDAEFVLHSLRNVKPVQLGMQQIEQTTIVLASTSDDTSGGIPYSLKLVGDGPSVDDRGVRQKHINFVRPSLSDFFVFYAPQINSHTYLLTHSVERPLQHLSKFEPITATPVVDINIHEDCDRRSA